MLSNIAYTVGVNRRILSPHDYEVIRQCGDDWDQALRLAWDAIERLKSIGPGFDPIQLGM